MLDICQAAIRLLVTLGGCPASIGFWRKPYVASSMRTTGNVSVSCKNSNDISVAAHKMTQFIAETANCAWKVPSTWQVGNSRTCLIMCALSSFYQARTMSVYVI